MRRRPPGLLLLLTLVLPAQADLKIATRTGPCSSTSTRYTRGSNFRIDTQDAYGPQQIAIYNADQRRSYALDPASRTYTATPVDPPKPVESLQRVSESRKTIDIYLDTVDTGERRRMFGHLARHVIQSERRGSERIEIDGWYIDLPGARAAYYLGFGIAAHTGTIDRIDFHRTGPRETGLALLETRTVSGSPGATFLTEVSELDESPLDPKTFAPPPDFHQVPFLPQHRPYTFLDTLRADWTSLVCSADELLQAMPHAE
jgi:hypothetical protein